jgi:hypothetical protein
VGFFFFFWFFFDLLGMRWETGLGQDFEMICGVEIFP